MAGPPPEQLWTCGATTTASAQGRCPQVLTCNSKSTWDAFGVLSEALDTFEVQ